MNKDGLLIKCYGFFDESQPHLCKGSHDFPITLHLSSYSVTAV